MQSNHGILSVGILLLVVLLCVVFARETSPSARIANMCNMVAYVCIVALALIVALLVIVIVGAA